MLHLRDVGAGAAVHAAHTYYDLTVTVVFTHAFLAAFVSHRCLPTRLANRHSGLSHQLAQMVLAEIVSLCWTTSNVLRVVQALKFVELVGGNLLAITNVAICVNLALIVSVSVARR